MGRKHSQPYSSSIQLSTSKTKIHYQEARSMAAKGVFCFVLISALATFATSLPWEGRSKPLCDCINPFVGTRNAYRGDSDALCGSGGPGFCYVPCNAVATSNQLPAHQGASLSTHVMCNMVSSC